MKKIARVVKFIAVSLENNDSLHKDYKFVYHFSPYDFKSSYFGLYQKWFNKKLFDIYKKIKSNYVIVNYSCDEILDNFIKNIKPYDKHPIEIKRCEEGIYVTKKE